MKAHSKNLSKREREVVALLLQGKSNKQIALALKITESTVEFHLKNVYAKLQVGSRTEAILKLGKSIDWVSPNLGVSTVDEANKKIDNSGKFILWKRWMSLMKETIPSGVFFELPEVKKYFKEREKPRVLLGHTRAATGGALTKLNAQPFSIKHIIGAHNGVMDAFVDKDNKDTEKEKSDSYLFYEMFAESSLEEALKFGAESYNFAYALTWIDLRDNTLNFLRNKERPLWRMSSNMGTTTYWASEPIYLNFVDSRSIVTFTTPALMAENLHAKFYVEDKKWEYNTLVAPKTYKVTGGTPIGFFQGNQRAWDWDQWERDYNQEAPYRNREKAKGRKGKGKGPKVPQGGGEGSNLIVLSVEKKDKDFIPKDDNTKKYIYHGFKGARFSLNLIKPKLDCGCAWCSTIAKPQDTVWWIDTENYICLDCYQQPMVREITSGDDLNQSRLSVELKKK